MKKYLAEFIGTFALVFCGTGAAIVNQQTDGSLGLLGVAAAFGIIVAAIIYVFGTISGAHINPAVTISLALGKIVSKKNLLGYIISQILGGILASSILYVLFPNNQSLGATIPLGSTFQSFSIELLLTFILMLTILGVSSEKEFSSFAGLIIGLVVTGIILFAGPVSGGSFNPARSIAPAIISGNFKALWIYLSAPVLGAVLAMLVWKVLKK